MSGAWLSLLLLASSNPGSVEQAVQALLDGHTARFPLDARLAGVTREGSTWVVRVDGTFAPADELTEELRRESLMGALDAAAIDDGVELRVKDASGAWVPLFPRRADAPPTGKKTPRIARVGAGALSGKRIALSAGHGWLFQNGSWGTQRSRWDFTGCGNCRGITEDFFTSEVVTGFVIPLLQNMGATVVLVREPDHGTEAPIVLQAMGETQFSVVTPGLQKSRVALRWTGGSDRTGAALLRIQDLGGTHDRIIDERANGDAWNDQGAFWFGASPSTITLTNMAGTGILDVDALKIGGGVFADSGKPWWQMGAESYVPYAGAPSSVTQYGDVSIRPAYAEYVDADVYVSIHANASGVTGGSSANGISIYRYSCQMYSDHSTSTAATGCDDPPRSTELIDIVHAEILGRIRADWDPNYGDRGRRVANFGEVRTLVDMPGILIETGFFDNLANPSGTPPPRYADNRSLHDPRWREAFAYGLVSGLAKFFDAQAGAPPVRPTGLAAINATDATMTISWDAVQGATKYRLYQSSQGRAFDAGVDVTGTTHTITGIAPGTVLTFRVAAVNAHGEGLQSHAVAARFRGARMDRPAHALIVAAFDRRDAWVQEPDNDFMYSVEHARAVAAVEGMDVYFDGAQDEAVETGRVPLTAYRMIDVETGKDSTADRPLSKTLQDQLRAFVDGGGALLISGEEVGYALVQTSSDPDEAAFLSEVLGATYVEDDADTYTMRGAPAGPFSDLGDVALDDGTGGVFDVVYPDVLAATGQGQVVLTYPDGRGAAIATPRTIFVGAPLEAIVPELARNALFARAIGHLLPGIGAGDLDEDGASDDCETQYGFDRADAADGALDADNDGRTNAQECADGTDPRSGMDAGTLPSSSSVMGTSSSAVSTSASTSSSSSTSASMEMDAGTPDSSVDTPDAAMTAQGGGGDTADPKKEEQKKLGPFPLPSCGCVTSSSGPDPLACIALLALIFRLRRARS